MLIRLRNSINPRMKRLWNGPANLPSSMQLEWKLVWVRWAGIILVTPALLIAQISSKQLLTGFVILVAAIIYNLSIQISLRRHSNVMISGFIAGFGDAALAIAMIVTLGGFDAPFYFIVYTVVIATALRFNHGPVWGVLLLIIGADLLEHLVLGKAVTATFFIRSIFLITAALLAVSLSEQARQNAVDLERRISEQQQAEQESKWRVTQLALINKVGGQFSAELKLKNMLNNAASLIQKSFDYQHVGIFILVPKKQILELRARAGSYANLFRPNHHLKVGQGMVGWAAAHGEQLLANDVSRELRYVNPFPDKVIIQSELSTPIQMGDQIVGVLDVQSQQQGAFDDSDRMVMQTLADQLAIAITNAHLHDQLRRYAGELETYVAERTAELQKAYERLKILDTMKNDFINSVSHELRTPITVLKMNLHLLENDPAKHGTLLPRLTQATDRLASIVEGIIFTTSMQQKLEDSSLHPVDLQALVVQAVGRHRFLAGERGLELTFIRNDDLPTINGDQGLLVRVLEILLSNALNYTPEGGQVMISMRKTDQNGKQGVFLDISNTGPAIPPNELPLLFERFFRGNASLEAGVPGSGLGLFIARQIVERHGGTIELQNSDDEHPQVTFTVWLPEHDPV